MSGTFPRSGTKGSDNEMLTPVPGWKQSVGKNYAIAAVGEFLGTFLFLFFAFAGTQCAKLAFDSNKPKQGAAEDAVPTVGLLLYVALAFGMSLAVNVWIFYRVSGGLFNPAVTVGVMVLGKVPMVKGAILIASQLLGGIFAAGLVEILLPGNLSVNTGLSKDINTAQGLFLEAFLTFELMMAILMLAVEKHRATFIAPLGIGLALFIAHLTGIFFTGASLNPARSFGPAVITRDFPNYHWIYWLGPCLGSVAASGFYKLLLLLEYKTANPGQDDDGLNHGYSTSTTVHQPQGSSSIGGDIASRDEISPIRGSDAV